MPAPQLPKPAPRSLICPQCLGSRFTIHQERFEDSLLFFTRSHAYERHECDGCGFSLVIR